MRRRAAASTPRPGGRFPALSAGSGPRATAARRRGRQDRPELAQDAGRRAPDRQAVQVIRPVAQRPFPDRALDHRDRRVGQEPRDRRFDDAGDFEGRRDQGRPPFGEGDDRCHLEIAHRDPHPIQPPHDADAGADRVECDLFGRLSQRRRGRVGILRLGLAAREADFAGVVAVPGGALDEHDPGDAAVVRVEQHEHGGRPARTAGWWDPRRSQTRTRPSGPASSPRPVPAAAPEVPTTAPQRRRSACDRAPAAGPG